MTLAEYFAKKRTGLMLTAVCTLIFAGIFWLYRLPPAAAVYPGLLCFLVLMISGLLDFRRERQLSRQLQALEKLPDSLWEDLQALGCDRRYAAIIQALLLREKEYREKSDREQQQRLDYFTTWVHQIKTPIAAMRLNLEQQGSPESRLLKEELLRVEQYVQMVLSYLRLDSQTTDFVFRKTPLDPLIRGSLRRFAPQFIGKGLALRFTPTEQTVTTDEKWLCFVLEQILSNALKYTPAGSVTIGMENDCLFIRDTGIGIAPEDLPRIFQQGYTGFNGRLEQHASGIGLYLSKRICDNLGIRLCVSSRLGVGTEVQMEFPKDCIRPD